MLRGWWDVSKCTMRGWRLSPPSHLAIITGVLTTSSAWQVDRQGGQGDFVVHSRPDTRPLLVKNSAFLICRASWRPLYSAGIYYIVGYRNICYWTH